MGGKGLIRLSKPDIWIHVLTFRNDKSPNILSYTPENIFIDVSMNAHFTPYF